MIPDYTVIDNLDGSKSIVRVTGIEEGAFDKKKDAIFSYEKFMELTDDNSLKSKIQAKIKKLYDNVVE